MEHVDLPNSCTQTNKDNERTYLKLMDTDSLLMLYFYLCRVLQEQNEGLQQSLLKTAVRMECLGEEFISSQKILEEELQRTRVELGNLTERFIRSDMSFYWLRVLFCVAILMHLCNVLCRCCVNELRLCPSVLF